MTVALLWALSGCTPTIELYALELSGEIVADGSGPVTLEVYADWVGVGELRHPLGELERFALDGPGPFEVSLFVPGEVTGLVAYAWQDLDGDDVLCGLGAEPEPAGLTPLEGYPSHQLDVSLTLDTECVGPEALFP